MFKEIGLNHFIGSKHFMDRLWVNRFGEPAGGSGYDTFYIYFIRVEEEPHERLRIIGVCFDICKNNDTMFFLSIGR